MKEIQHEYDYDVRCWFVYTEWVCEIVSCYQVLFVTLVLVYESLKISDL